MKGITRHITSDKDGSFVYELNDQRVGEMHYRIAGDHKIIVDHTVVEEEEEGHGIGKKLLEELVNFARKENIKVVPQCSYAHAVLKRTKEWQDILSEDRD